MRRKIFGAFTLLEVMVAVAILGIALTAIFSSEAGAIRVGARARHMSVASLLARCKMGEIEENILREGMPAVSDDGRDECCEGGEQQGFRCEWSVERVELPDALDMGADDPTSALGSLTGDHEGDTANPADMQNALAGAAGGDALGSFAVQFAFPVLRPAIEEQVRRATVTVFWAEGEDERSFDVVQYLVADQGSMTSADDPSGATAPGTPGTLGAPATPTIPRIGLPGAQR
ncbi:MAG: prepilin-type N-terminal cleavage/methylation domain-containing protein [Sandaracinaceae bacterium]|nr:MAG: prepilin-type N-terminal cleavage/methylation domain-containing protein [Sandaracinaceae bacterium]